MRKIDIIDSHTGGEPTRIVVGGGPGLGGGSITDKLNALKNTTSSAPPWSTNRAARM